MITELISPVSQDTLAEIVKTRIREAIILGELTPGKQLTESSLASKLAVSRSPVREALHVLEIEGLVCKGNKRAFHVWTPTEKDVDEIISLRVMMESLAAELVIANLTDEDFELLNDILERQRQAIETKDFLRLTSEDRYFHDYFVERSQNSRLNDVWKRIMTQWEVLIFRRIECYPEIPETVLPDHIEILSAFKEKDVNQVIYLHRTKNLRVADEMKSILRREVS